MGELNGLVTDWLDEMTVREMMERMNAGELTSEELTVAYLQNIAVKNASHFAILEVNPQAVQIAKMLDMERRQGLVRSPMHGIPVLLKDNMDTGDSMHTSCGSLALSHYYAADDAFLVKKLRAAGAVILGKTNMTEWANFMSDRMRNGWSSRGGQVMNPYGPFDVGGSSSGAAVAVADNLTAVSIGTETSGSIINPSTQNSIVGIKPTVGAISRTGIIPLSFTQDTPGPMARTVEDALFAFEQMIGFDEKDPVSYGANKFKGIDWQSTLDVHALKGVKIGVARKIFEREVSSEEMQLFDDALKKIEALGGEIVDHIDLGTMEDDLGYDVLLHEFKSALNGYLERTAASNPIRTLKDIIQFNNDHAEETLKYGQAMLERSERTSGTLTDPSYIEALLRNRRLAGELALDRAFDTYGIQAIVFPKDHGCSFSSAVGYPAVAVPASFTKEGEPFGIIFCGKAYDEPKLIGYAYAFEQFTRGRKSPSMRNS
ncbi:amidase family protein [Sporosarcina contaminans]|uniref:Amidase family protein n=1 Tax=Sporosarcina contaminans TaxID=633403 RepID=A0ABW3U0G5_9BACL